MSASRRLLNALVRRSVARTSAAPGKTRLANIFRLLEGGPGGIGLGRCTLVDLRGLRLRPRRRTDSARSRSRAIQRRQVDAAERARAPAGGADQRRAGQDAAGEHLPGHGRRRTRRPLGPVSRGPARLWLRARRRRCRERAGRGRAAYFAAATPEPQGRPSASRDVRDPRPDRRSYWSTPASRARVGRRRLPLALERRGDAAIVATKVDKLSRAERARNLRELERVFGNAAAAGVGSGRRRIG